MSPALWILLGLGAMWLLFFTVIRLLSWATRPRRLRPAAATPDLPVDPPPPAVVGYLVNDCRVDPDAAVATLVDLAARRYLELFQPLNDPDETIVRILDPAPAGLAPFEQRVFARVLAAADAAGAVPLRRITRHYATDGERWGAEFGREVAEDVKARKLSSVSANGSTVAGFLALALSCITGTTLPAAAFSPFFEEGGEPSTWVNIVAVGLIVVLTGGIFVLVLIPVTAWFDGPRATPAGRDVGRKFLGVGEWLRGHGESFAALPPASVRVWDRYLSYGAALGVTPVVSRSADLTVGTRAVLWSDYTGEWREVRVRYPRRGRKSGYPPLTVITNGLLILTMLGALAYLVRDHLGRVDRALVLTAASLLAIAAARSVYRIARAAVDLASPVHITGRVLSRSILPHLVGLERETFDGMFGGARLKSLIRVERMPFYLVVDDGRADRAVVWSAYPAMRRVDQCDEGDEVRLKGYRWCRYARELRRVQLADVPVRAEPTRFGS